MATKGNSYPTWPMIDEEQLQAYVDGELSPEQRTAVEGFLAANPNEAERIRGYQMQRIALQALTAPIAAEPLSEPLDKLRHEMVLALKAARRRRRIWRWTGAAAAVCAFAVVGWSVLIATGRESPDLASLFTQQATRAHALYDGPSAQNSPKQTADLFRWFARRVIQSPASAPDLRPFGFKLVGSQVIPTPDRPNIQLVYADEQNASITLMMSASQDASPSDFRFSQEGELSAWYWSRNGLQFGLVGQMPRERLLEFARAVSWQMSDPPEAPRERSEAVSAQPVMTGASKNGSIEPVRSAPRGDAPLAPGPGVPPGRISPVGR